MLQAWLIADACAGASACLGIVPVKIGRAGLMCVVYIDFGIAIFDDSVLRT